jgi:WD40 repeat protein
MRAAAVCLFAFAAAASLEPACAGGATTLNRVWSRVADVNGELGSIETAQFSPDGRFIVSGSKFDYALIKWRTSDGAEVWRSALPQEIEKAVWTRDGKFIAVISEDRVLRLVSADDGRILREVPHEQGIDSVEVSRDGRFVVTGQEYTELPDRSRQGWIRVFTLPDLRQVAQIDHGATVNEMDFSPDGRFLVSAGDNSEARLWRTSDWGLEHVFRPGDGEATEGFVTTRYSPDGSMIAVSGFGGDIHLWSAVDRKRIRRINRTGRKNETVAWSPDGRHLLAAGHDDAITLYAVSGLVDAAIDHDSLPATRVPVTDSLEFMQFNRQGSLLVTSHQDGTIQLWTYMSDDPTINTRRHAEVRRLQDELVRRQRNGNGP